MIKYLVEFSYERDNERHAKIFLAKPDATWRELQQKFDPSYRYDNLVFYSLGSEIPRNF